MEDKNENTKSEIDDSEEVTVVITGEDSSDDEVVEDPAEQLLELNKSLADKHEQLLRTAAELDNLRKRSRRDVEDAIARGRVDVLTELLPSMDSIDMAISSADPEGKANAILEGMGMVRRQFITSTERFGLKEIVSLGQPFDPNFHEAVAQQPSEEYESGTIMTEMRKGYMLGDRLVRAAMVVVSIGKPNVSPSEEPADNGDEEQSENGADDSTKDADN